MTLHLILGGARSGKSRYAESRAIETHHASTTYSPLYYIATGEARDDEMAARIEHHRLNRVPDWWQTIEEPRRLAGALNKIENEQDAIVLIDCLTLWVSNMLEHSDVEWKRQRRLFLYTASAFAGRIFVVSNEVGQGIVPMNALARRFIDETGRLHQDLASIASRVTFVTAGIPQDFKS